MSIPFVHLLPFPHRPRSRRDWSMLLTGVLIPVAAVAAAYFLAPARVPLPYQGGGLSAGWLPPTVTHWQALIDEMAKKYNLDPTMLAIVMTLESGGDAHARSSAAAQGLMQVTPPTAKDIATKFLKKSVPKYNLQDPRTNIEFGAAYLAYLRDLFGNTRQAPDWNTTVELITAGYNGGPGAAAQLEKGRGLTDIQTVVYSRDALNMWRERHANRSPTYERWKERGGYILIDAAQADQ
ncbi:MAG: lytic transglycosylase domain-containing protein [Candidatus Saccharibacteria bacterium]